jgi:hypothetical protein
VGDGVGDGVGDSVGDGVGDSVGDGVGDGVGDSVGDGVGDGVGEYVGDGVGDGVGDSVGDGVGASVFCQHVLHGRSSTCGKLELRKLFQVSVHGCSSVTVGHSGDDGMFQLGFKRLVVFPLQYVDWPRSQSIDVSCCNCAWFFVSFALTKLVSRTYE